ncbi:hypothetical protein VNO77_36630 [Canavalia gladiata]|uniref:Uncharacterized protein n=1 Tax=Canavalia gladiata TaxID=3824 RepID=A0AAN9KAA5_CANGL
MRAFLDSKLSQFANKPISSFSCCNWTHSSATGTLRTLFAVAFWRLWKKLNDTNVSNNDINKAFDITPVKKPHRQTYYSVNNKEVWLKEQLEVWGENYPRRLKRVAEDGRMCGLGILMIEGLLRLEDEVAGESEGERGGGEVLVLSV